MPKVGQILKGKVIKLYPNGALVKTEEEDAVGYVPINEIVEGRWVKDIHDELSLGQLVEFRVLRVNPKEKRYTFSIKKADKEFLLNEKLENFKQDSANKFKQLRKNTDRKRDGRKRKKGKM